MNPACKLLAVTLLALGCSRILGMEEAHLDPSLELAGSTGSLDVAGVSTVGGNAGAGSGPSSSSTQGGLPTAGGAQTSGGALSPEAGAAGEGGSPVVAPSLCEQYCEAVLSGCPGDDAQYIDNEACLAICARLPEGAPGDTSGNSTQCRLTYAEKAPSEPYTYCTWAGPGGDGRCGSNCDGFCSLMMQACSDATTPDSDAYFASLDDCLSTCQGLKDVGQYCATNQSLQMGADHVQCRLYHVGAALAEADPLTHCPHAMGERLCVDPSTH